MYWTHRLTDTLSYKIPSGISDGDYSYGSLQTASARIEEYPDIVPGTGGEEAVSSHRVASETDLPLQARCWVDTADTGDVSRALRILRKRQANLLTSGYTLYIYTLGR